MGGSPITRITHYRGRSDTGAIDASPTFIAAEDTAFSVTPGTNFRIRIGVDNTATATDTITAPDATRGIARCGYADATFSTYANVINGADAGASADATNVATQRLTSGVGTFETGLAGYDENESLSTTSTNGKFTEVEFGVVLTGGASTIGVGGGETWTFQVGGLTNASVNVPTFTTPDTNGSDFTQDTQLGGAGQQVANSASISMTTAAAVPTNGLVVVVVVCDNNGTTDSDFSEVSGVTIDGLAAKKAKEFTNGQGTAQTGVTTSIWYRQFAAGLATSKTITASFTTATTNGDANCIQARSFAVASGKSAVVEATASAATDAATQPASLDCTTSNIECLRVCAHGFENSQSTANQPILVRASNNAWSLWWTDGKLMRASTDNTTGTSNVGSIVEATVTTGTGKASQIGALSTTMDWASAYVAFKTVASQTVTPGLVDDSTDTFYAPKMGRGLKPGLVDDSTDTFHAPTVTGRITLLPGLYDDSTDTFYAPYVAGYYDPGGSFYITIGSPIGGVITYASAASTQNLAPGYVDDSTDTFYVPKIIRTIKPGYVDDSTDTFYAPKIIRTIYPGLYTNSNTFYAPTIRRTVYPGLYTNSNTFYAPTVGRGARNLQPGLYDDSVDTFYAPKIIRTVKPGLYDDSVDTFFSPTVGRGARALTAALYTSTNTFYQPTVTSRKTLFPGLFDDSVDTFYSPTVTRGARTLTPALYTDGDTIYQPTVTPGVRTLLPGLYTDTDTVYQPTVTSRSTLFPNLYTDGDTFYQPTVTRGTRTLLPGLYTNTNTIFSPTIISGTGQVFPGLYDDSTDTFYSPTVTRGARNLTPGLYTDVDSVYQPTVTYRNTLFPGLYSDTDNVYQPTVTAGTVQLLPGLYQDGDTVFSPVVSQGATTLSPGYFQDADIFYSPTVTGGAGPIVITPPPATAAGESGGGIEKFFAERALQTAKKRKRNYELALLMMEMEDEIMADLIRSLH